VKDLSFQYGTKKAPTLKSINLELPPGSRTLLVGDNGAGKSTLLKILSGTHLTPDNTIRVLGKDSYFDTSLNHERAYCSTDWGKRTVAFTGHDMPLMADIGVSEMMAALQAQFKPRRDELVALLGIDLNWRMHELSDGQRRRVQIMLQLLRPVKMLLLDEITTDLDLITRQDFLNHLKVMSERDGVTIIYATHIFDGLDGWPTHMAFIADGTFQRFGTVESYQDLTAMQASGVYSPLLRTVEQFMRAQRAKAQEARGGAAILEPAGRAKTEDLLGELGNGYLPGRLGGRMGYN